MSNVVPIQPTPDEPSYATRAELLEAFHEYLIGEALAPRTIRLYVRTIERVIEGLERKGATLEDAGPIHISELSETFATSRLSRMVLRSILAGGTNRAGSADTPPTRREPTPRDERV